MKLCFIVDARSPTAKSWISYFVNAGDEVSIISTYPCSPDTIPGAHIFEVPIAAPRFSSVASQSKARGKSSRWLAAKLASEFNIGRLSPVTQQLRACWGPIDVRRKAPVVRKILDRLKPDLVHAMRLPYEGFLATESVRGFPLLISIWGTDFSLFATRYAGLKKLSRSAMVRADAIHCDCQRDIHLAIEHGFARSKRWRVLPGGGGIHTESSRQHSPNPYLLRKYDIPEGVPLIINPRGFRHYVRNDVFFRSIPMVLAKVPNAVFLATAMQGSAIAERWIGQLCIGRSVRSLPQVDQAELTDLFRVCELSVSPSLHDGTPNSLLEAMAAGCLPIAGDLQSVREWIAHGENGLLVDANDANSVAAAILRGLHDTALRSAAAKINKDMISLRADYSTCMGIAREFYTEIIESNGRLGTATSQPRGSQCAASLAS